MKRYILHTPFNIYHFEATTWVHAVHKHTYFEIIFILRGNGIHNINGNTYSYSEGDVFLLGPEDYHYFVIHQLTEFCFIRFNESIHKNTEDKHSAWQPIIKTLLSTSSQSRGSIVVDKHEKRKLHYLLAVLEEEYERHQSQYFAVIRDSLLRSMLMILARNLFSQTPAREQVNDSVEAILMYIRQHIYQPNDLSIDHLADVFNYSPAYISLFFKKQTGESLKQYIIKYKIKLIEARLLYSPLTLAQIADEFGYTDESHFCKQFRKYTGSTPTAFRKRN
ncbi:AraC family transcriptional regulator [Spirosoma daeguense]